MSWKAWLGKLFAKPPPQREPDPYSALVEPYRGLLNSYDDPKAFLDQFAHLPEPSKHLFAAEALVSEVANGGFSQLFLNSTGVLAPEGVKGLKAIGMPQAAAIAEEAMAWFGSDYPRDYYVRNDALAAFEEAHGDHDDADCPICTIDDRFYAVMSDENGGFEDAANQFAKRHAG